MTTLALSENDGAFCFLFGDFVMEVARGNGPKEGTIKPSRTVIHADRAVEHPIRIFEDGADGENVNGKSVTFVLGCVAKFQLLQRTLVNVRHALDRIWRKRFFGRHRATPAQ